VGLLTTEQGDKIQVAFRRSKSRGIFSIEHFEYYTTPMSLLMTEETPEILYTFGHHDLYALPGLLAYCIIIIAH
jgi:hypothetical protein